VAVTAIEDEASTTPHSKAWPDIAVHGNTTIEWMTANLSSLAVRFYGVTENKREIDKDMREMVDRVKAGKPLYGTTELTDYMQGVAARNSRYTGAFLHVMPMFNFVNHNQVCCAIQLI
jgi:hypothetical protein